MQKESVREVGLAVGCAKSLLIQNPCQFSSTGLHGLEIIDEGIIILINTSSLLECLPDLPSLTLWDGGGANSGACSLKSISSDSFQHSEQEYELIIINNIVASRRKSKLFWHYFKPELWWWGPVGQINIHLYVLLHSRILIFSSFLLQRYLIKQQ